MSIKRVTTKNDFTEPITLHRAKGYLEQTLSDASKMDIHITWGFDEQQADPFHRGWTGEKFLQCIERILQGK